MSEMEEFLNPESVAVVGASRKPGKIGHELLRNIIEGNYEGEIYPINPSGDEVLGLESYSSVLDVENDIDLAVLAVPAPIIPKIIEECGEKGIRSVVIVSAGFSEAGNKDLEDKLVEEAEKWGIRVIGPNCTGIANYNKKLHATMETRAKEGNIGFISQSGALGGAILAWTRERNIGLSKFVSYGNACDIAESETLEYLAEDPKTKAITLYLEGVKDGEEFINAARKATRKKPVIAVKGGLSEAGAKSVASHTSSLAGNRKVFFGIMKQTDIIRAEGVEDMFDMARAVAFQKPVRGKKVAVVTNSGGPGVLATDKLDELGLEIPSPPAGIIKKLDFLPDASSLKNPIDMTAEATSEMYGETVEALFSEEYYDAALVIDVPVAWGNGVDEAKALASAKEKIDKPIAACWMAGHLVEDAIPVLEEKGIQNYSTPKRAAQALWALSQKTHEE